MYATSRQRRDELERRRAEEQTRLEAEAQRLIEEKRRREEEEQRRAEEERAQAMREAALLQKQVNYSYESSPLYLFTPGGRESLHFACFWLYQREEEQARERARAEELRKERELLAQKEDAARQARKKVKLENIWWKYQHIA